MKKLHEIEIMFFQPSGPYYINITKLDIEKKRNDVEMCNLGQNVSALNFQGHYNLKKRAEVSLVLTLTSAMVHFSIELIQVIKGKEKRDANS